jgi:signal transduction histidine kinase
MIVDKVTLLNETVLECLNERNETKIFKAFMNVGIKILEADFGFAWQLKNPKSKKLELVCKSRGLPFTPTARSNGRNYTVIKNRIPIFVDDIEKTPDVIYVSKYLKSYAIIPLVHKKAIHGSMVMCFKKLTPLNRERKTLAILLGNSAAQALTIHRLVAKEKDTVALKEKQKATDTLLEQEKLKSEFIANTTHEFRTPLTIMRGYVYLATKKKNGLKAAQKALTAIDEEIVNLSELLSDLVLITAGRAQREVELVPVNITKVVHRAADKLKNIAVKEKDVRIFKTGNSQDVYVLGDEKYMERLFLNLIRNAITYGGKKIGVDIETKKGVVSVHIADDGIGISKENLPHIFERFFRADKSHNREGGHSGLGLPIAKWIVGVHHGKINVKSSLGKGSTFTVTMPLKKAKPN